MIKNILNSAILLALCVQFIPAIIFAQWTNGPALQNARQDNAAATGPDGKIYVAGGVSGLSSINSVEVLDPLTSNTWSSVAAMSTNRARFALVFGADGYLYAIGGLSGNNSLTSVERYNTATNTWQTMASMNTSRCQHAAAVGPDGRIYVIGGYTSPTGTGNHNSVEVFNPPSTTFPLGQWVAAPSMVNARANHHAVTGIDGNIYVFDGGSGNGWEVFNGTSWTDMGNAIYSIGPFESVTAPDGLIYQLGYDAGIFNGSKKVTTYDASGQTSNTSPDLLQGRAVPGGAACAEGRIYVSGGYRKSYGTMNFVEYLPGLKAPDFIPNCKALWRFDALNGTTLVDSKGSNPGTALGAVSLNNSGRINKSIKINDGATGQGITVNNSSNINFGTGSFSIEGWIKWNKVSGSTAVVPILDKRTQLSGKYSGYHLYITSAGKLGVQLANGSTFKNYTASQTTIQSGKWIHIAVSVDRTSSSPSIKIFVNSVMDQLSAPLTGNITNTAKLSIGKHSLNNTEFKGEMDELGMYNRALIWAEVRAVFLAGKEGKQ
jgi:hypothetical protein